MKTRLIKIIFFAIVIIILGICFLSTNPGQDYVYAATNTISLKDYGAVGDGIADDYTALNSIFSGTWFILLSSTIAFIISAIVNNFSNAAIGKMFKKNPDGKAAFVTRTYISTFIGQFIDNLVFSILTFMLFAPIFWDGFHWAFLQCLTCSLTGALAELLMEIIFSPLGYKICKKWDEEKVGQEYLDYINNKEGELIESTN